MIDSKLNFSMLGMGGHVPGDWGRGVLRVFQKLGCLAAAAPPATRAAATRHGGSGRTLHLIFVKTSNTI